MEPPFLPGYGDYTPPPDMITDQVAELARHAVELPPISDFLYDEPPAHEQPGGIPQPQEPVARATPSRAQVPPLPGFTPARPTPAHEFRAPAYATPAASAPGYASAPTPATESPEFSRTPTAPQPQYRQTPAAAPAAAPARPGDDWATGEWQRYDWRTASALAPEERARAAQAWSDLDWESDTASRVQQRNESVAGALEAIARRVRAGELIVHGHPGMSEAAAAAAALAALLATRRS